MQRLENGILECPSVVTERFSKKSEVKKKHGAEQEDFVNIQILAGNIPFKKKQTNNTHGFGLNLSMNCL